MSEENGPTTNPRQSRREPAVKVIDKDFADDLIMLLPDTIQQAQQLVVVRDFENAAKLTVIGLSMNASKTEHIAINIASGESSVCGDIKGL